MGEKGGKGIKMRGGEENSGRGEKGRETKMGIREGGEGQDGERERETKNG